MNKFILIIFSTLIFSCREECVKDYDFSIPLTLSPLLKDTFRIGDTLWLSSEIPFKLQDRKSKAYVDVTNFNFLIESFISRLDTTVFNYPVSSFKYINSIGKLNIINLNNEISYFAVQYQNDNASKKLKVGLIPTKAGVYNLHFSYLTDNLDEGFNKVQLFDEKCSESFEISFDMNNSSDDFNYHFIKQSPQPITTAAGYKRDGSYAFIVK